MNKLLDMTFSFEGNFEQLRNFLERTFNSPSSLIIKWDARVVSISSEFVATIIEGFTKQFLVLTDLQRTKLEERAHVIAEHIKASNNIMAIKELRDITGCGLKESKTCIEFVISKGV